MLGKWIMGLALAASATTLAAQDRILLSRAVFVERQSGQDADRMVERANVFHPGETVILVVEWQTRERGNSFTVSSRIPAGLQYRASSSDAQTVSIDGGKNWGRIGSLRIGNRLASVEDVTHLRWNVPKSQTISGRGKFTYSAIVR